MNRSASSAAGLRAEPREAEATAIGRTAPARLFHEIALLAMVASGFLALLGTGQLDLPTAVLLPLAMLARAAMVAGWLEWRVSPALVTVFAALYIPFYVADYWWLSRDFFNATIHMICFIAVVKLLTAAASRDFLYLKLLATMELLAAAMLSAQLTFFLYLAIFLFAAMSAFTGGEIVRSLETAPAAARVVPRSLRWRLGGVSASLFAGMLLLTVTLFFVLPRTARAAFQRFGVARGQLLFTSEVTLGDLGELKQSNTTMMHVRSYDGRSLDGLRWRGGALTHFDGKRWFNPPAREQRLILKSGALMLPMVGTRSSPSLGYSVELSEMAPDTLFFAGTPESIQIEAPAVYRSAGGSLRAPRFGPLRYGAYSNLLATNAAPLSAEEFQAHIGLPQLDPRVAELARQWGESIPKAERNPMRLARAIEERFHHDFRYTLDALDAPVRDPLAHFLFERKAGHCEYFASGMAVMLRTQGIPARVATGFLGGIYNSISGWQVLRAADAHSWVEAWIPGRGWTTFDPTPPDLNAVARNSLWTQATLVMDAADQFWRDWVVTYDAEHQSTLVSRIQQARRGWQWNAWSPSLPKWPGVAAQLSSAQWMLAAILMAAALLLWKFGRPILAWWSGRQRIERARRGVIAASDATRLYERMLLELARRGFRRPASQTPQEFVDALPGSELSRLARELTVAYNRVRFGGDLSEAPHMARLIEQIERSLANNAR